MPATPESQPVAALSWRAWFDFEEESRVFESGDDRAYMPLQLQRVQRVRRPAWPPRRPGPPR
jgi:5'-nucleotidase